MLGLLSIFFNVMCEVFFFFLSTASSILVVGLYVISLKFMQGEKYMCFANLVLFISFTLLSLIRDSYSSLHFTNSMVMYFYLSCWIWIPIVHLALIFSSWCSGIFGHLTLKLMWEISYWFASILFSMVTFHVFKKLDLTILVSDFGVVYVIENVFCIMFVLWQRFVHVYKEVYYGWDKVLLSYVYQVLDVNPRRMFWSITNGR